MSATMQADVIVIGGGLVGASAAFHLRRERGMSVILLERGLVGSQASGVNFGNVRRQGRYLAQLPLAHRSREIWGRLPELLGEDCEFLPTGHLKIAYDDDEMLELETYARDARDYGLDLEVLSAAEVRDRHEYVSRDIVGACFSPNDGHANPRLAAPAFARAARREGAAVVERCEVREIVREPSGFRIEAADGREFRSRLLVNAAGAWGARIAQRFGEPAPLTPRGPQMAVTEALPYFIHPVLGTASHKVYMRQVAQGSVVFGGGARVDVDLDNPYPRPRSSHLLEQLKEIVRFIPALANAMVVRTWSGVEGYFPDMIPVIGPSATTPGLVHAFGLCGHGFQIAPAVGAVVADLLADGRTETPIDYCSIARFRQAARSQ